MKKIAALIIAAIMVFSNIVPAHADIAPFNVSFSGEFGSYSDIDIVMKAAKLRSMNGEIAQYLHDESNPIDVKAAVINALGWHYDERGLVEKYVQFSFGKSYKNINLDKLGSHDLFCIGYLTFIDGDQYTEKKAIPILEKAKAKMPESFTVALVTAFATSELLYYKVYRDKWKNSWAPIQAVYDNKELTLDMRYGARRNIFESLSFMSKDMLINPFKISADPSSVTVTEGMEYSVHINGGEAPYEVKNVGIHSNISVAGDNLIVKGLREGKTQVEIVDKNGSSVLLPIQVNTADTSIIPNKPQIMDLSGFIYSYGKTLVYEDWVYYSNWEDNGKFYRIKTDGTGKTKLSNNFPLSINIQDDWLYFRDANYGYFYKMSTDGRAIIRLIDDSPESIYISGDWIYYGNRGDEGKLYKVKTDGTERTRLNDDKNISNIRVDGDWIFYTIKDWNPVIRAYGDKHGNYKAKTDGSQRQKLD
ncbi:MAG TPA: DUF5050 domain-containing protein [Clostridia bacterium]|nr:DUF5050 domain-containing protein [Clostridia bacterium]